MAKISEQKPSVSWPPRSVAALVDASRWEHPDERARLDPDADAVTDGTITLSWSDYVDLVARTAAVLAAAGVDTGDRVAIRLPKSVHSFVAVHAIIRCGAVMVPIDPMTPADTVCDIALDADIEVMVTAPALIDADVVQRARVHTLVVPVGDTSDAPVLRGVRVLGVDAIAAAPPLPAAEVQPEDPAYIIYTSGSTGRPKGIVHTHASAMAYAVAAAEEYGLTRHDRFANIAPLHFDQSTFELYAAALVGGCVLVVPEPIMRFPASLSQMVADARISVWYSVPYLLVQLSTRGVLADRDLSPLRWVLFGGESFPPGQLAALMRQLPGARFSNVYGPAEVNQCTAHHLDDPPADDDVVPIGGAWSAASVRVVDPDDGETDQLRGEPGVLLVHTPTMMQGYWKRPDLTDRAIHVDADARRWYVTGDLVVEDTAGQLVFLGRLDNQVKVRGHRIELEAIDAILNDLDDLAEATVVVRREGGDDRLVAVVVFAPHPANMATTTSEQRIGHVLDHLHGCLPRHAVPSEVVGVQSLPRTSTDKVDRQATLEMIDA